MMNIRTFCCFGLASVIAVAGMADVTVGPDDGFAAVKNVSFAKYEKTKDSLVFSDIKFDLSMVCRILPLDTSRVTGFAFRYRVKGETTRPKAGGEVFYAPLGEGFSDARKWWIPPLVRDGEWHEIRLSLSAIKDINDWRSCGFITDFRFDPTNAEGGRLEIAWFRFITSDSVAKKAASVKKVGEDDEWPELKPETFKYHMSQNLTKHKAEAVEFLGGTALPRCQTAGKKVRLRYAYRGVMPKIDFLPVTVLLVEEHSGDVKWSEDMSLPLSQCAKLMADNHWAIEFDYELPHYIDSGIALIGLKTPCLCASKGYPQYARIEIKRMQTDPEWKEKVSASVVEVGGSQYFAVNGKPVYALWGSPTRSKRGRSVRHSSSPFNFVTVGAPHLKWWPKGYEFNPTSLDEMAERYRREYPGVYFIWDITICPPPDWRDANPDEMARDEQGNVNFDGGDSYVNYSFASKKAFDDMEHIVKKVIDHLEHSPYANRIVGYRVNSGHTIEWLGWDPKSRSTILDFSPAAQKGFEAFAKKHYPWIADFSVPTIAERRELDGNGSVLWDQHKHARAIAYHDFYSTAVADGAIRLCRAAKKAVGGKKLVGTYYGYSMTINCNGNSHMRAHFATQHFLEARAVDFMMSPQEYHYENRRPGVQLCDMKPFASIGKYGIVPVIEDDTRTHNSVPTGYNQTLTEEMTVNIMRRNMGVSLCRNQPFYTMALTSGYEFDFPRYADDSATLAKAGQHALAQGVRRNAQVAVVVSEVAMKSTPMYNGQKVVEFYPGRTVQVYENTGKVRVYDDIGGYKNSSFPYVKFYSEISRIGAGVDFLLAEDLEKNPGDYRLYIFQICTKKTPSLVRAAERLRKRNCTILWTYAPGYTADEGNSVANMKELTGMDFVLCSDVTDPGVTLEDGSKVGALTNPEDGVPLSPIFAAARPDKVLGRYSNGAAGLAEVRTGKARTFFSGSYVMTGPLLQKIARSAGVHIYCDSLDPLEANDRFISFHARNSGRKTIRLPRKTTVVDVFNRELVAKDAEEFAFEAPLHSTRLFYCADDAEEFLKTL